MSTYKVRSKVVPYLGELGVGPKRKAGAWRGEEGSRKFAAANYLRLGAWHFLYVDKKQSEVIRTKHHVKKAGFGSIRVAVTLGKSKWTTSIFPDKQSGTYLLPLKKAIRQAEGLDAGDTVSFTIRI